MRVLICIGKCFIRLRRLFIPVTGGTLVDVLRHINRSHVSSPFGGFGRLNLYVHYIPPFQQIFFLFLVPFALTRPQWCHVSLRAVFKLCPVHHHLILAWPLYSSAPQVGYCIPALRFVPSETSRSLWVSLNNSILKPEGPKDVPEPDQRPIILLCKPPNHSLALCWHMSLLRRPPLISQPETILR